MTRLSTFLQEEQRQLNSWRFYHPEETQERVRELLRRSKSSTLTEEEADELERFSEVEHLMQLVKARAHLYVNLPQ